MQPCSTNLFIAWQADLWLPSRGKDGQASARSASDGWPVSTLGAAWDSFTHRALHQQVIAIGFALLACAAAQGDLAQEAAPALGPASPSDASTCACPAGGSPGATIAFQNVADTARFYAASSAGSILVFFDAQVNFTTPPANLSAAAFTVPNGAPRSWVPFELSWAATAAYSPEFAGAVLVVNAVDNCTSFELRGYVRQDAAWNVANTTVTINAAAGAVTDCSGAAVPTFSVTTSLPNKCVLGIALAMYCMP